MICQKDYTIKDIARELNISKSTVSRVLRNCHDVSEDTRVKVCNLVEKLNFEPNSIAKQLKQRKTFIIGVVIPSLRIPFYSMAICGIQKVASTKGYNVMICQNEDSSDVEAENIISLMKSKVDGLLISLAANTSNFSHVEILKEKKIPIVLFNRVNPQLNLPMVSVNDYKGAYMATEYLISRGNLKIAFISGPSKLKLCQDRLKGYLDCLTHNAYPIRESLIFESNFNSSNGETIAKVMMMLPIKPDAIFCISDSVAFGVLKYLKMNKISVPGDISVMGFTNEPLAEFVEPGLSTVAQPIIEIGENAAHLLLDILEKKKDQRIENSIIIDPCLIIRESTN